MSEKYSWMNDEIPLIEPHSIVKHEVIKRYINQYINTICKNPRVQQMKLVVVDGFCGGGIYKDQNNKEVLGSPFVIITATANQRKAPASAGITTDFLFYRQE